MNRSMSHPGSCEAYRKLVDGIIFPRKLLEQIQIRTDRRRYRVLTAEGQKSSWLSTPRLLAAGIAQTKARP